MDIKAVVDEVLALPNLLGTKLEDWTFEHVFQLSLDVAVLVMKKTTSASKEANAVLVASVVSDVIDQLKLKALSSVAPEKSTEVSQNWDSLKNTAAVVLPVVLSRLPHLNVSRLLRLLDCFSVCKRVSSAVAVVVEPVAVAVAVDPKADADAAHDAFVVNVKKEEVVAVKADMVATQPSKKL
jgi:hypothetical protein